MFRQIRYQTGEIKDVVNEMKNGNIPCMDVDDYDELQWVINELENHGVYKIEGLPYDKNARDRIKEPEFEFRISFCTKPAVSDVQKDEILYIDFYFEPDIEDSYDPVGEM